MSLRLPFGGRCSRQVQLRVSPAAGQVLLPSDGDTVKRCCSRGTSVTWELVRAAVAELQAVGELPGRHCGVTGTPAQKQFWTADTVAMTALLHKRCG